MEVVECEAPPGLELLAEKAFWWLLPPEPPEDELDEEEEDEEARVTRTRTVPATSGQHITPATCQHLIGTAGGLEMPPPPQENIFSNQDNL